MECLVRKPNWSSTRGEHRNALRWVFAMIGLEKSAPLKPHQPVLYIECCPINFTYKKLASDLHRSLADALNAIKSDMVLQLRINEVRSPRYGSFEVFISPKPTGNERSRHMLWTGISRVPAAAKVPHVDDIIANACAILKLRYSRAGASQIHLADTNDREIRRILQRRSL